MFCSECGRPTEATNKFCPTCGHKAVEKGEVSSKKDGKKDIKCLTFEQFAAKKRQERSTHFRTSSKTKKKSKDTEPFALINIGLMKYISADTTTPVRGKSLPLKVKKDAPYAEVFTMALTKREAYDKSFDTKLSWNLVYPDGQPCSTLPGQEEEFTLRKYKEDLGKPYNRITLYLCPDEPDNMNSEDIGSDDHHQYDRDQNVRKKEQKENDTAGYIGPQNR
ncbi:uncharacterized protein LOC114527451 [Dendronephthya gigantea]|uniref:uncharacterized protein LOC114527451 n=1 Tax=Dendronephthya gigantea TaxID=151771 RepID=UPI00106D0C41|nr:uncharacterized protein LOC114527451 [Dendronephthya gigantea]